MWQIHSIGSCEVMYKPLKSLSIDGVRLKSEISDNPSTPFDFSIKFLIFNRAKAHYCNGLWSPGLGILVFGVVQAGSEP
jgi:hypothetical protein